eukprot:TRINITY_DN1017_c0_g1_i1.p1 TRINITY_DN1017_c0_g1~~TRINITY_DN1017_c0_g1_i1.p1  ORF type:complete len:256 (-),score=55.38 TRINITY_DN1017_c0_g1_i1:197-964(-)
MSGIGTGYDLSTSTYSPDGRVFQVEYAGKAVDASGTVVAVKCKDGIVMAVEKMVRSKLLVEGSNRRSFIVSKHAGIAVAGFQADARQIVLRARAECEQYKSAYGGSIPPHVLNDRIASFMHLYSVYWTVRPFGVGVLLATHGRDGHELYTIDQAGAAYRCYASAVGKARMAAKTEIEKLNLEELSAQDALFELGKIIHTVHDDVKDKAFELELSWISDATDNVFQVVPKEMKDEIETRIKAALEEESDDEEEDEE